MRVTGLLMLIGTLLGSCAPGQPRATSASLVPTVPLHVLARSIADYRGRIVRTCGPQFRPSRRPDGKITNWRLSVRDPTSPYNFPAIVRVLSCHAETSPFDSEGCVTGRIAREDGSLDEPDVEIVGSHEIVSYEWWLHPQCPSR